MTGTVTTGITLETPQEVSVLLAALAMAEATQSEDNVAGTIVLNVAAAALREVDPDQHALRCLVAKSVVAFGAFSITVSPSAQDALKALVGRVQEKA